MVCSLFIFYLIQCQLKPIHIVSSDTKLVKFGWHPTTFDFEEFGNIHKRIKITKTTTQNDFISFGRRKLVRLTDDDVCVWCGRSLLLVLIAAMLMQTFVLP